jgi:hypothetical protein
LKRTKEIEKNNAKRGLTVDVNVLNVDPSKDLVEPVPKKLERAEKLRLYREKKKAKAKKVKSEKKTLSFKNLLDSDRIYIF